MHSLRNIIYILQFASGFLFLLYCRLQTQSSYKSCSWTRQRRRRNRQLSLDREVEETSIPRRLDTSQLRLWVAGSGSHGPGPRTSLTLPPSDLVRSLRGAFSPCRVTDTRKPKAPLTTPEGRRRITLKRQRNTPLRVQQPDKYLLDIC